MQTYKIDIDPRNGGSITVYFMDEDSLPHDPITYTVPCKTSGQNISPVHDALEVLTLHILHLHDRLAALEEQVNELP